MQVQTVPVQNSIVECILYVQNENVFKYYVQ